MSTTWILLIAVFVVLYLVMHRGHGGHGDHGAHGPSARQHAGHGCGHNARRDQGAEDEALPRSSRGTGTHSHG